MSLTWSDLGAKFKELEDDLPFTRVEAHWGGSDGEVWELAGMLERGPKQRFETLARIAGNKLRGDLGTNPEIPREVMAEHDPVIRWYKAVWKMLGGLRFDYRDQANTTGAPTTAGKIKGIIKASYTACAMIQRDFGEGAGPTESTTQSGKGLLASIISLFSKRT